ncbi:MAG TPA: CBS domain-containing protein [Thermoanaerobaculaceae bacterium]|nr:CBS domain-containing protein [Thermoanaerobaculaceae bacterium]
MQLQTTPVAKVPDLPPGLGDYRFLFFSELLKRPVCAGKIRDRIGRLADLVFALKEPYPEAVGIYLEHGWGKPTEFIPWDRVVKVEDDAVFVKPADGGAAYPPFTDQPGWILIDKHLMGRTILDMDGRRTEVVNDVHLLEAKGRLLLVHVDTSFNGIVRRWGLGGLGWIKDNFISWKYVQPLSVEDAVSTDKVSLSVTRRQLIELPSEDLADALEELSGEEQQALFSALDSEKAAETLAEAEPRAQRQLIANLRKERARNILSELSVAQLADLFSVLPHDDKTELMELLPGEAAQRIQAILSEREATARALMSSEFVAVPKEGKVGALLDSVRRSGRDPQSVSYIYVVGDDGHTLVGVIDLRELLLARDDAPIAEVMVSPVVSADEDDVRDDLVEIFAKYHYRMIPVVDRKDRILGVIYFNDIMKGLVTRAKD